MIHAHSLRLFGKEVNLEYSQALKAGLLIFFLLLFLLGSRLPSELKKITQAQNPDFQPGSINFKDHFPVHESASFIETVLITSLNFWDANANGMTFAIVIGGAAMSLLASSQTAKRLVGTRGAKGAVIGAALGLPLNMCANCSAVTSCSIDQGKPTPETTLGIILGSALFNVVGLAAIYTLFPLPVFIARLVFGLLLIFLVLPLVCQSLVPTRRFNVIPIQEEVPSFSPVGWREATQIALREWWKSCATLAYTLLPIMIFATMLTGLVRTLASREVLTAVSADPISGIVGASFFGTFLSIPVLFEVPLAYLLSDLGFSIGAVATIICTAPSVGLFTVFLTRKQVGTDLILVMLAATCVLGAGAGFLAEALVLWGV